MLPNFVFGNRFACIYCGDPPTLKDHVIAVSRQTIEIEPRRRKSDYGPTVWCCSHCNEKLGNRGFDSFDDRCRWVSAILDKRAAPIIWTPSEMRSLGYGLRTFVQAETQKRRWYRQRADWYGSRDYMLSLESLLWQKCLDPYSPKANAFLVHYFHETLILVRMLYDMKRRG